MALLNDTRHAWLLKDSNKGMDLITKTRSVRLSNPLLSGLCFYWLLLVDGIFISWMFRMLFLHCVLEEEVYMYQPPSFVDPSCPEHLCRLEKALYGLKQVPLDWHALARSVLCTHGFVPSIADMSLIMLQQP
jgi:hypothetical protein